MSLGYCRLVIFRLSWLTQVGVPRSVAWNMTFPDLVSWHNLEEMKTLVQNGPDQVEPTNSNPINRKPESVNRKP